MLNLVGQLRRLVSELRPAGLEELGLVATLGNYVEQLRREGGAGMPEINMHLDDSVLPAPHALCLFRVTQEALRNALHHAQAGRVDVALEQDATGVTLRIADDGCGFDLPPQLSELISANHFGLVGMTERVAWAGGQLQIETVPGRGTTITVRLPLNGRNDDEQ
jgi:signal transduction histidine kinase